MVAYHKAQRESVFTFIQVDIPFTVNQRIQVRILLGGFGEHIPHRKKGRGKGRRAVKAVEYLAVAHPQFFVELLHMAVCRGRE